MEQKLVFIDVDGTLFDHSTNSIPDSAILALEKAHKNGHLLFLCTGRANVEINNELKKLLFDGYILSCGAHIIVNNEIIYSSIFPKKELHELIAFMLKHNIGFSLDGQFKSYLSEYALEFFSNIFNADNKNSEISRAILAKNNMYPLHQMKNDDYDQILKISLFSKELEACETLIKNLPHRLSGFLHSSDKQIINGEISQKNVNKATGIDKILNHFNADIKDTIAIGDSLNDIEMIEHANIGICMGNGDILLKQKADFITKDISIDGLYHAFKHLRLF